MTCTFQIASFMYSVHELIFHSFIVSYTLIYIRCSSTCTCTFLVQLQFSAIICQNRPRVIFKYSFWQPEECVRPKKQTIMYACSYCSKVPAKYSRQRDVTIITSTHVVINYHYNQKTRGIVDNRPSNDPQVPKSELY